MELVPLFDKLTSVQEIITDTNDFAAPQPLAPVPVIPPTPNNPPWNSGVAVAAWFVSVLLILIVPVVFLAPYVLKVNGQFGDSVELAEFLKSDPTAIILQISSVIPAHILTIILAWLIVTRIHKFPFFQTLGWQSGGIMWWISYGAIVAGFFALSIVVANFFPEQENDLIRILRSSRTAVYLVAFMATFTAPFVEEVIYRGILYSAFQRTFGVVFAVICVTLLFALVHVPQYYPSYSTIFLLTVLSLTLTVVRVRTNNLLPCVILHTAFNASQSALLLLQPYTESVNKTVDVPSAIFHLFK